MKLWLFLGILLILGVNMLKKVNVQCLIWGICTVHYNYLDVVLYHYWR